MTCCWRRGRKIKLFVVFSIDMRKYTWEDNSFPTKLSEMIWKLGSRQSKIQLWKPFLWVPPSLPLCISNTNLSLIKSVLVSELYRHSDKIRLAWWSGPDGSNDHFSNDKIGGGGGGVGVDFDQVAWPCTSCYCLTTGGAEWFWATQNDRSE